MQDWKQYHGYLALPRQALHLRKILGSVLFGFYIDMVFIAIWSRKSKHLFGKVMMNQGELAEKFDVDQGTISKKIKALQSTNRYLIIKHKKYFLLGFFPLFTTEVANKMSSNNYVNLDELYAEMHRINEIVQENYEKMQERLLQKKRQSLIDSSKDNVSFSSFKEEVIDDDINMDDIDIGIENMIRERK